MASKEKAPCKDHPDMKRYANGVCSGCALERKRERYEADPEKYRAYAREHAKHYVRKPLTNAEKERINAKRRERYAQNKRNS